MIDPTGHYSWGEFYDDIKSVGNTINNGIHDFAQGIGAGILESISYDASSKLEVYYDRNNEVIYLIGKVVGDTATGVVSGSGAIISGTGAVVTSETGVGAIVCGGAAVYCGSVTVSAAGNASSNILQIVDKVKNGGGGGSSKPPQFKKPMARVKKRQQMYQVGLKGINPTQQRMEKILQQD